MFRLKTWRVRVKDLIQEGKVEDASAFRGECEDYSSARATAPVAALQSEYSLFFREPEEKVMPTLEELGIGFVPFSPLAKVF